MVDAIGMELCCAVDVKETCVAHHQHCKLQAQSVVHASMHLGAACADSVQCFQLVFHSFQFLTHCQFPLNEAGNCISTNGVLGLGLADYTWQLHTVNTELWL